MAIPVKIPIFVSMRRGGIRSCMQIDSAAVFLLSGSRYSLHKYHLNESNDEESLESPWDRVIENGGDDIGTADAAISVGTQDLQL